VDLIVKDAPQYRMIFLQKLQTYIVCSCDSVRNNLDASQWVREAPMVWYILYSALEYRHWNAIYTIYYGMVSRRMSLGCDLPKGVVVRGSVIFW
jgi:hypothetical protein